MTLERAIKPRFPVSLPRLVGADRVIRRNGPWLERMIVVDRSPMLLRIRPSRSTRGGEFVLAAHPLDPDSVAGPGKDTLRTAGQPELEAGITRLRHAFGLDDALASFREEFIGDELLGPVIRRRLSHRPMRRPDPWEALLWAITEQLIQYRRAAAIQRRMIRRYGLRIEAGPGEGLATVPSPEAIAAAAPAELQALDLGAARAAAAIRVAREVAAGRIDPENPEDDRRLLAIPIIGPWTVACLALRGRGEPDALLAGDLAQVKLVGYLAGLGRLAEIEEVEEFYRRFAPWRGIAGELLAAELGRTVDGPGNRARIRAAARPLRRAA